MIKPKLTAARTVAMAVTVAALLSGCGKTGDWIKGRTSASSEDPEIIVGEPEVDEYIAELGAIAGGDPAAQAEIFADAFAASQLTPGPSANLRLGLVLSVPGHPESNPEMAQSILREALTQTSLLTPGEIALATIQLNNVERQIVANAETRRLRASSSRAAHTQEQAITQRLNTVEAENRRLRRDLEEAEEKLEAITSIERSIREQE
jgi:hypothetical protein